MSMKRVTPEEAEGFVKALTDGVEEALADSDLVEKEPRVFVLVEVSNEEEEKWEGYVTAKNFDGPRDLVEALLRCTSNLVEAEGGNMEVLHHNGRFDVKGQG
jgi:hypothetical protein